MKTIQSKDFSFAGEPVYIGIDVHKKQWTVSIMTSLKDHKTFVQPPQPEKLVHYVRENFPGAQYYSVYEAGFCGFWIHEALSREGVRNIVVNPADVPTSDKEKKQKYDHVDSRKLCKDLRSGILREIHVPDNQQQHDRDLVRLRKKLVTDITRRKNRIKSTLHYYGIFIPDTFPETQWSLKFIQWLKEIQFPVSTGNAALNFMIHDLENLLALKKSVSRRLLILATEERYKDRIKLLRTIPGVGLIGALTFFTELGDITRFKNGDHLCSYVGLIPNVHSSGDTSLTGSLTSRKNLYVQPILLQCAWKAASMDPSLLKTYHQLCQRMKGQQAIIRIARKLLNRIRFVLINRQGYQLKMN
jgi:transposase